MRLAYIYISMILVILYNIKIFRFKECNENPLNLENSNAVKGIAAIAVVLHHISQRVANPGALEIFNNVGYLAVSLFFFYSGYGLMRSYDTKENYLNKFWTNRIPKILIPFVLANILFIIVYPGIFGVSYSIFDIFQYILGIKLIDGYKWYIIAMLIFYISFYLIFKYIDRNKAIIGMFLSVTCYVLICKLIGKGIWWYNSVYPFFIGIIFGAYSEFIFDFFRKRYFIIFLGVLVVFNQTHKAGELTGDVLMSVISSVFFVLTCVCILMKLEIGNKVLNLLGSISYEIYLVHRIFLDGLIGVNDKYVYIILCLSLSILLAYIFSIFEKYIIKICMNRLDRSYK